VKDLNGLNPATFKERLATVGTLTSPGGATPKGKHQVSLYLEGQWHDLQFHANSIPENDPVESLDVSLLQNLVLKPMLNITDPRTNKRIHFVGGIRGTAELENLVNNRLYACAFSMHPTCVEDLMKVADAEGIMPPKSTWFEPKLRDGLFSHLI
jgi:uncharacterized protein (DUF1015 family)